MYGPNMYVGLQLIIFGLESKYLNSHEGGVGMPQRCKCEINKSLEIGMDVPSRSPALWAENKYLNSHKGCSMQPSLRDTDSSLDIVIDIVICMTAYLEEVIGILLL